MRSDRSILALVADLTAEENRTKAMAMVGITIGFSFMVAVVAGPIVAGVVGVAGIFWLMVVLAAAGIAITLFVVPTPSSLGVRRDAETVPSMLGGVLRNRELLRLDFGIFALHAMLTASFLVVPGLLSTSLGVTSHDQWIVYLPVLAVSVAVMLPAIIVAEKHRRMKGVFVGAVAAIALSQGLLAVGGANPYALLAAVTIFFAGFNIMEASLPSLVTKTAPADAKGTATGVYSSSQFIGIFCGGVFGGWVHQAGGDAGVFALTTVLALVWLFVAARMRPPSYLVTRLLRLDGARAARPRRRGWRAGSAGAGRGGRRRHRRGGARLPEGRFEGLRPGKGGGAGAGRLKRPCAPVPRGSGAGRPGAAGCVGGTPATGAGRCRTDR